MMNVFILCIALGFAYSSWVPEMENKNPSFFGGLTPDMERYVEGDMIMTGYEEEELTSGFAYSSVSNVWPKNGDYVTIPYENTISDPLAESKIREAFADYNKYTCIRFTKKTSNDKAYLSFYQGSGCSSPVGYHGKKNSVSLASGCWHKGTIMHEIAHSLGIYHQQSRKDRDDHVEILWQNIPQEKQHNFKKHTHLNNHGTAYDYESMMHYGATAFGNGKMTIRTKDSKYQNMIGQRSRMSTLDKKQINAMYNCKVTGGGDSACQDYKSNCAYWQGQGLCTSAKYQSFMTQNCPKACGFCVDTTCEDKKDDCSFAQAYCKDSRYKTYMTENCAKTCAFC